MGAKHTPGPWEVRDGCQVVWTAPNRAGAKCRYTIASVYVPGANEKREQQINSYDDAVAVQSANAHLLAASLELLEACQRLCRRLEVNELVNRPEKPGNQYDQPDYDFAIGAISKAGGGTEHIGLLPRELQRELIAAFRGVKDGERHETMARYHGPQGLLLQLNDSQYLNGQGVRNVIDKLIRFVNGGGA